MEAYVPPESLWRLVEENVAPGERQEIRDALGDSLVEQSLELRTEVRYRVITIQVLHLCKLGYGRLPKKMHVP